MNWKCPQCDSAVIYEEIRGATLQRQVRGVDKDGHLIVDWASTAEDGTPFGYQCGGCEAPLTDGGVTIQNRAQMAEFLRSRA